MTNQIIKINENDFINWLQQAWLHKHDGWNRDYWCDTSDMSFWHTTETQNTSFENGSSVILIHHEKGDNNYEYTCICNNCSAQNFECENNCEEWEDSKKTESFEDFCFGCMDNADWIDNVQDDIEEQLKQKGFEVDWVF